MLGCGVEVHNVVEVAMIKGVVEVLAELLELAIVDDEASGVEFGISKVDADDGIMAVEAGALVSIWQAVELMGVGEVEVFSDFKHCDPFGLRVSWLEPCSPCRDRDGGRWWRFGSWLSRRRLYIGLG